MIVVERESRQGHFCNSCNSVDKETHKVSIGASRQETLIIRLCAECLDTLYNDCAV
jgi:hypothetical protein